MVSLSLQFAGDPLNRTKLLVEFLIRYFAGEIYDVDEIFGERKVCILFVFAY